MIAFLIQKGSILAAVISRVIGMFASIGEVLKDGLSRPGAERSLKLFECGPADAADGSEQIEDLDGGLLSDTWYCGKLGLQCPSRPERSMKCDCKPMGFVAKLLKESQ